jgi:sodium transport system permease protein
VNLREIGLVWRKELLDILRDRRTIMAMIVVPLLVYPILMIVISQLGLSQMEKIRQSKARVALVPRDAPPSLLKKLQADSTIVVIPSAHPDADLAARNLDAVVEIPDGFEALLTTLDSTVVNVRVDLSRDRGERMSERIRGFLVEWRDDMVAERLAERDLPPTFVKPFTVEIDNVAGDKKMGGSLIGRILPFFLVVMMMSGALYPAIDVTAGERERGTLETLLVVPAKRFNIVLGKFMTVFLASMVTTLANIVSIAFTVFFLIRSAKMGGEMTADVATLLDWRALVLIFIVMIPMAILFAGVAMLVASFARSFKEAQNYLSPLMIVCMAPAYLSFLPGVEINATWALVPIANVVLLSRELLLGNYVWSYFFITIATMTGLALLLLNRTVRFFGHETMLGGGEGAPKFRWRNLIRREPGRKPERLTPALVAQVFLVVLLGFFYVGTPLQLRDTRSGLLLTQLFVIAGIPLLALRFWGIPPGAALGLKRRPKPLAMLLVLIGAPAATLIAALVGIAQGLFLEVPESYRELMERIFQAQGGVNLVTAVVVFAIVPGICEELLFRGFVLRGLATRLSPPMAIAWTAVLFGAFHFDMYRLLPTTVLGLILGALVWLTGSLWPAMLLHAANNTIAVLANNLPALRNIPWLQEGTSIPTPVLLTVGVVGALATWGLIRLYPRPAPLATAPEEAEPARELVGSVEH